MTVEKTAWLLEDAVKRQMCGETSVCTFLSGGVDSSLVTAICARELEKQGKVLDTFSFDFEGNQKYFQSNAFQPSQDRPWVEKMVQKFHTNHVFLECDNENLLENLYEAVDARDLPCMADVESSMLYFCRKVAEHSKIALTGECADEIFGGYPWFHKEEALNTQAFPWSFDMKVRQTLLSEDVIQGFLWRNMQGLLMTGRFWKLCFGRGDRSREKKKRNGIFESEMVYGNADGPYGPHQLQRGDGCQSAFCGLQNHRIYLERALGHEMQRRSERTAAPCRRGKSAGRGTVEEKKPLSQNLSSPV